MKLISPEGQSAIDKIHKQFGSTSLMRMGDRPELEIESLSTGNISIDLALGIGGFPRGRVAEVYGPESSGKSTLMLHTVAEAQKLGKEVAYIDAEHALDPGYAEALGVDVASIFIAQPTTGEEGLEIVDSLAATRDFPLIVVDSVAALTPRAELKGEMGDSHIGAQARMMSQAMRKIVGNVHETNTTVLFVNQLREKVGVMWGSPEVTPGGRALKFYSSVRIDIRRIENVKDGSEVLGSKVRLKVVKNKVAPPFKQAEVDVEFGKGFLPSVSLLREALSRELVQKSGSWYATLDGEKMGQGERNAAGFLDENPEFAAELRELVLERARS